MLFQAGRTISSVADEKWYELPEYRMILFI
jgi:hypothetical protein